MDEPHCAIDARVWFRFGLVLTVSLLLGIVAASGTGQRGTAAVGRADGSGSYGYPVKPFFVQHPVRGILGDPRIGPDAHGTIRYTLHFGVDIVAADGTPVYATITGWVSIHPLHADTVMISDGTGRVFEYWHVVPAIRSGHATAYKTVVGHIEPPWAHVNFSERRGSTYLNPLRPGAMGPYRDVEPPRIVGIRFERAGRSVGSPVWGAVDVVAETYDRPAMPVPEPWSRVRLTPALVRWRILGPGAQWHTAFDVRTTLPTAPYSSFYAEGTRQNRTYRVGRYRFVLAPHWNSAELADGSHTLQVSMSDIRGNATTARLTFATANR